MEDDCCTETMAHPDYSKEMNRLNRIAGQVEGVKKMVSDRRYCPDILIQLRAIRSAVAAVETSILGGHLDSCVADAFNAGNPEEKKNKMAELKELYRKYNV
ncbi:MAG: csoR [Alphaproteobacteria bacterium]|nr:csoR [Alphaproteobacteria bacterium]